MNETTKSDNTGQFEHRFSSLETAMRDFLESDRQWKQQITEYIRKVDDKASNAGKTDMATLAVWAGVVITIIVAIGGSIGFLEDRNQTQNQQWIVRELDHHWTAIENMGSKFDGIPTAHSKPRRKMSAKEFLEQ